jgi:hypothetical protein
MKTIPSKSSTIHKYELNARDCQVGVSRNVSEVLSGDFIGLPGDEGKGSMHQDMAEITRGGI